MIRFATFIDLAAAYGLKFANTSTRTDKISAIKQRIKSAFLCLALTPLPSIVLAQTLICSAKFGKGVEGLPSVTKSRTMRDLVFNS